MLRRSAAPILFGFVFTGFGILFLTVFGQGATLRCTRPEPSQITCERETRWLNWIPTGREAITGVTEAYVSESCDDGCTYRVELETTQGSQALTSYYTSGYGDKADVAQEINDFLAESAWNSAADSSAPLEVTSDAGFWAVFLSLAFIFVGSLFILSHLASVLRLLLATLPPDRT